MEQGAWWMENTGTKLPSRRPAFLHLISRSNQVANNGSCGAYSKESLQFLKNENWEEINSNKDRSGVFTVNRV